MVLAASAGFLGYPPAVDFGSASLTDTMQATGMACSTQGWPIRFPWPELL
jgi:hypothetical protein